MLALKYMAIASFSRGSGSTPKLVALLANQEVQDEGGAQVGCSHQCPVCQTMLLANHKEQP
jgi:hypothetical protein